VRVRVTREEKRRPIRHQVTREGGTYRVKKFQQTRKGEIRWSASIWLGRVYTSGGHPDPWTAIGALWAGLSETLRAAITRPPRRRAQRGSPDLLVREAG
jgi:hypothetical protein